MAGPRYLLDTNVVDCLAGDFDGASRIAGAVDRGRIEVLVTHVQIDELAAIPDQERRSTRFISLVRVRPRLVETSLFVFDLSRLDLARLSDEREAEAFNRHLGGGTARTRHAGDATLAGTAATLGAAFVTENTQDRARTLRGHPGLRIISYREFLAEVDALQAS